MLRAIRRRHQNKLTLEISAISFDPEGRTVAAASESGAMVVFQFEANGTITPQEGQYPERVLDVAFTPEGHLLVAHSEGEKGNVFLSRPLSSSDRIQIACGEGQMARFSPSGTLLAVAGASDGSLKVIETATGRPFGEFPWDGGGGTFVAGRVSISPDDKHLVYKLGKWRQISLFDLESAKETQKLLVGGDFTSIYELSFSHDSRFLLASTLDDVLLWDLASLQHDSGDGQSQNHIFSWAFVGGTHACAAFSPSSPVLALGWGDVNGGPPVEIWDMSEIMQAPPEYWRTGDYWMGGHSIVVPAAHWQPNRLEQEARVTLPMVAQPIISGGSASVQHGKRLRT